MRKPGHEHAKHFDLKKQAEAWLAGITTSIGVHGYARPDAGRLTFRAYAEEWRGNQVHRLTTAHKVEGTLRKHVYPTFGDRELRQIRPGHVQSWVKRLSLTLAPSTVAVAHGIVAGIFKQAVRDREITDNPCEGTKLPEDYRPPVEPLTTDQVMAMHDALPERYRALVTLMAATGLRQGEALGLTVDRSGLWPPSAKPVLKVDRQLVTISGKRPYIGPPKRRASNRDIPLPAVAVEALRGHLVAFPTHRQEVTVRDVANRATTEVVELVFTNNRGEPIRRNGFSDIWRKARKVADVPETTTPHDLRHYYASLLIAHGENVKVVQSRLGHATAAETLDTYAHLWPDSEDRTRAAVDEVLGAASRRFQDEAK